MKKILIVDDNRTNLINASRLLSDEYDVMLAISGEKALELCEKYTPDLVLLDINMPNMDGFEVLNRMKQSQKTSKIPVIFLTASNDIDTEVECIERGAVDFLSKPFIPKIMKTRIKRTIELEDYRKSLEDLVQRQLDEITHIQNEVIFGMANLIESRDGSTGIHVKRTYYFVRMIAHELRRRNIFSDILTESYVNDLCKASPMHDIGKIAISDIILKKPGRLSEKEFEIMKTHSSEGGRILRQILSKIEKKEYVDIAFDMATYHHERWDGTGYPLGLKDLEIPISARIMAVADVFDALISERCYKNAMTVSQAFEIIERSSGTHFDPIIAEVFISFKDEVQDMLKDISLEN